jgi:uncharacterized protein YkwD
MVLTACVAAEPRPVVTRPAVATGPSAAATAWYAMTPERFMALPEARREMSFASLDRNLLAAAIFHATNRQRVQHGFGVLEYDAAVSEAARLQASVMAAKNFMGHENPFDPSLKTPLDRILKVGLKPRYLAENVAMEYVRNMGPGQEFYTRTEKGAMVFSLTPDGPPIPMHSYVTFAEMLLDGWMNSPGHRANILSEPPRMLGCAGAPASEANGLEKLFCAQVFFTPARVVEPEP